MDITLLSRMLRELVTDHDSVGLPGMGTFVAQDMPATFADKGFTINPPYRKLSFYEGESDNDLLVKLYAGSNSVEPVTAAPILLQFVSELKSELEELRSVSLPGLGRMRLTKNGKIFFVADEDMDISAEYYGLRTLSLKSHRPSICYGLPPVEEQQETDTRKPEEPKVDKDDVPATVPEQELFFTKAESPHNNNLLWLIAIPLAVILFFGGFLLLAEYAPDFLDRLLYTDEQLEIIRNWPW